MAEIKSFDINFILDPISSIYLKKQFINTVDALKLSYFNSNTNTQAITELNNKISSIAKNYHEEKSKQYIIDNKLQTKIVTISLMNRFSFQITNLEFFITKLVLGITMLKLCEKYTKLFYVYFPIGFKTLSYSTMFYWSYKHYIKNSI